MNTQAGEHTNFWTYILLVAFTAIAAMVTEASSLFELGSDRILEATLIIITGLKIMLVTEYFMELHNAPLWLRGAMMAWVVGVALILVTLIFNAHWLGFSP